MNLKKMAALLLALALCVGLLTACGGNESDTESQTAAVGMENQSGTQTASESGNAGSTQPAGNAADESGEDLTQKTLPSLPKGFHGQDPSNGETQPTDPAQPTQPAHPSQPSQPSQPTPTAPAQREATPQDLTPNPSEPEETAAPAPTVPRSATSEDMP